MKAKLFLFYLRYRKLLIFLFSVIALVSIGADSWLKYKSKSVNYNPWRVDEVMTGESFTVARDDETKTIKLCGITAAGDEARDYLKSLIDRGDGTVQLEEREGAFEAWVLLKPNFERQLHLNTWMVQEGMARHDKRSSGHCRSDEALGWAAEAAKDDKLGIWQR
ncbi:thermonuclease family protein [Myxosarcina sp. GI1(2024)]